MIEAWFEGLKPDAFMTISQWSDQYRFLSPKSAAEPGRWRTERTPYLREIMNQLSPHQRAQRVVFMKGAQIDGTEDGNNLDWICYPYGSRANDGHCVHGGDGQTEFKTAD